MANKNCYVVTDNSAGWDCVRGVYMANSEDEVAQEMLDEYGQKLENGQSFDDWLESNDYIIHETSIIEV